MIRMYVTQLWHVNTWSVNRCRDVSVGVGASDTTGGGSNTKSSST
jgi:hypothetical protein